MAGAAGVTVGSVWLDVLPSMRNFGNELTQGVDQETRRAGESAGENLGDGTERGFSGKIAAIAAVGAAAGVAIGATLMSAFNDAMDMQQAQARLAGQLNLTAQDSERYGRIAGDVYSNAYGESLDQVNEAIRGVHQNIGANLADDEVNQITQSVLSLADAFEVDVGPATNAVGQMIKTGLAPDSQTALNIITAGFQNGADRAEDFLDTLNEYGTQFQKMGIDGATATGLITQGLAAGARDGDLVADAIKEFSIRAVDGSTSAADAYKMLGLNAAEMTAQIARGGPEAQAGLQTVLDRLRPLAGTADYATAAFGLFGTQSEDLGAALLALDPSTAAAGLGDVAGAADNLNNTLGDTAASRIEGFRRSISMTFVELMGTYVIPIVETVAGVVGTVLGPALDVVGFVLGGVVVPALTGLVTWLQASQGWLIPLAVGIGAFVLALNAATIATTLWGFATSAASTIMGIARGVVTLFQLGVMLLNAAIAANPIGILVAVLVGLVAAIVVAYNSSETFRNIVQGAFAAISTAVQAVGNWFVWLWQAILQPVFMGIWEVIRVVAAVLITVLIAPWILYFNILAAVFTWLWSAIVWPIFQGIGTAAMWLWNNAIMPAWTGIQVATQAVGAFFTWLWVNAIQPAFGFIAAGALFLWGGLRGTFDLLMAGLRVVGDFFGWVYNTLIRPALDGIGTAARFVWDNVIRPVFDLLMTGVRMIGDGFRSAVDGIQAAWSRIQGIVRPPVEFVVNLVYNNGIRPAWNFVAGLFDLPQLAELRFAKGGLVPGYSPGNDTVPALLSPGEAVLVPEAVRLMGAANILALNRYAQTRAGRRPQGNPTITDPDAGDIGHLGYYRDRVGFADGGIVGWIWDAVGAVGGFVGGIAEMLADPAGAIRRVFEAVAGGDGGGPGLWGQAIAAFPRKAIDGVVDWFGSWVAETGPAGNLGAGLAWARSQHGKPYQWGGGGNPSWDCSGFMAGITKVIRGETPGRIGTTATMPWPGFRAGMGGAFVIGNSTDTGRGTGHMAGTLLGTNVESAGGGKGVRVGPGALGATASLFPSQYTFMYDEGGYLPPGWSRVYNGTGRPEPVLTDEQWAAIANNDGGGEFVITSGVLEVRDDGLVRLVDGRIRSVGTALSHGRRA